MKITINNLQDIFKSKVSTVDTMQLKGYTLIEELFCDNSGFGSDNEPAYTQSQFERRIREILSENSTIYTSITSVGQFQVYVGVFIKIGKSKMQKVDNNTYKITTDTGYKIRLHDTDILEVSNNTVTLNNGGWYTKTTKERLAVYLRPLGYSIKQKDFQWYIVNTVTGIQVDYKNNLTLAL